MLATTLVVATGVVGVAVAADVVGEGLVACAVDAGCVDADREGAGGAVERGAMEPGAALCVALGVGVAGSGVLDLPDPVEWGQKLVPPPDRWWSRLDSVRPEASSTVVTTEAMAANSATHATANRCHTVRLVARLRRRLSPG